MAVLDRIPVVEGRTATETGTTEGLPLEAQEAPEMEEAQEARGEEVAPLTGVMMTDREGDATRSTSQESLAEWWLSTRSRL